MAKPRKYCSVSPEVLNARLGVAYNPPKIQSEADKHIFHDEYWACHATLRDALNLLGTYDAFGDGDFCMNEDWIISRGISVQLTSEKMIRPEIISTIQAVLAKLPEKYSIYVDHALLDLPYFSLLIEPEEVLVNCKFPDFVHRFGLAHMKS